MKPIEVALETGQKKVFAVAVHWPGWSRSGRDEAAALQALVDAAPRYARVMAYENIPFELPGSTSDLVVVERVEGNQTTDFGAPNVPIASDNLPVDEAELVQVQSILRACFQAFEAAVEAAQGKTLRTGPRGGGRDVERMIAHVIDSDAAYLSSVGYKRPRAASADRRAELEQVREATLSALAASARGELPKEGPRGGKIWPARNFARRAAWHILDHAWEIEDRIEG